MQGSRFPLKSSLVVVAIGASFWVGRASSPGVGEKATSDKVDSRSVARGERRSGSAGRSGNAEVGALKTAEDLRRLLKGGNSGFLMADGALANMTAAEIAALAAEAAQTVTRSGDQALNLIMSRWAKVDPDAALEFGLGSSKAWVRKLAMYAVFGQLAQSDPELAKQKADGVGDPMLRQLAQEQVLSRVPESHPEIYLEWITADPGLASRGTGARLMRAWAMDDPAVAAGRLKSLPPGLQREATEALASEWSIRDPAAARKWAEGLQDPDQKARSLGAAIGGMAMKDPAAAFAALDGLEPETRKNALGSIFRTMASEDPLGALERITSLPESADKTIALEQTRNGMSELSEFDSERFTKALLGLPAGTLKEQVVGQLGARFADLPRKEWDQFLAGLPPGDQDVLRKGAVESLLQQNPGRAIEMLDRIPDSPERNKMIQESISYIADSAPETAMGQASGLPQGPGRDEAMRMVLMRWAGKSPQAAIQYADSLEGPDRMTSMGGLIPSMAASNPTQAVRLYGMIAADPSGDAQAKQQSMRAAGDLASQWARKDPVAATQWAASLPEGADRSQAFKQAVGSWRRSDPAAARQAVEEASLPEEQKQSLLKSFGQ